MSKESGVKIVGEVMDKELRTIKEFSKDSAKDLTKRLSDGEKVPWQIMPWANTGRYMTQNGLVDEPLDPNKPMGAALFKDADVLDKLQKLVNE